MQYPFHGKADENIVYISSPVPDNQFEEASILQSSWARNKYAQIGSYF